MPKSVLVTKANGEQEPFDPAKLIQSLERAGAKPKVVKEVLSGVRGSLTTGIATHEIYRRAFELLRALEKPVAARYSLKRAVLALGPSGFPFEDYVGEIFRARGFTVATGQMLSGACVEHEVDLVAHTANKYIIGELKFHNQLGLKSDLKVALYVSARVEDIRKFRNQRGERGIDEGWLITNTKFTKAAVTYANCVGLKLVSWTYPRYGNLQDLIEETQAHPVTCLTTLNGSEKMRLMQAGIVLCKTLGEREAELPGFGISGEKLKRVLAESRAVCESHF